MAIPSKNDPKSMSELMTAFDMYMKSRGAGDLYLKKRIGGVFDVLDKVTKTLEKNTKKINFKKIEDSINGISETISNAVEPLTNTFNEYSDKLQKTFDKLLTQINIKDNLSDIFGINLDTTGLKPPKPVKNTKSIDQTQIDLIRNIKSIHTTATSIKDTILDGNKMLSKISQSLDNKPVSSKATKTAANEHYIKIFAVNQSSFKVLKLISAKIDNVKSMFQTSFQKWSEDNDKKEPENIAPVLEKKDNALKSFLKGLMPKQKKESGLKEKGLVVDYFGIEAQTFLKKLFDNQKSNDPKPNNPSPYGLRGEKGKEEEGGFFSKLLGVLGVGAIAALIAGIWKTGIFKEVWDKMSKAVDALEKKVANYLVNDIEGNKKLRAIGSIPFGSALLSEEGVLHAEKNLMASKQQERTAKITDPDKKEKAVNRDKFKEEITRDVADTILPLRKYNDLANKQARERDNASVGKKFLNSLFPGSDNPMETIKKHEMLMNTLTDVTYGKNPKLLEKIKNDKPEEFKDIVRLATAKHADELARLSEAQNYVDELRKSVGVHEAANLDKTQIEAEYLKKKEEWERWKAVVSDKIAVETKRLSEEKTPIERWAFPKYRGSSQVIDVNPREFKPEKSSVDSLEITKDKNETDKNKDHEKAVSLISAKASELQVQAATMQLNAAQAQMASISKGGNSTSNLNIYSHSSSTSSHREKISNMRQFASPIA